MSLIIVESPTKARTIRQFIKDKNYQIIPTLGHIRDLPSNSLAINYQKNFLPEFKIVDTKEKIVNQIKQAYQKDKDIIFATDPDREGESISYHVAYFLGYVKKEWPEIIFKKNHLKRIVFHEITPKAIKEAMANPQTIRINLVKAQMTRRILDRIVGYELSPVLWKKTGKKWLSAGRVQTVALRLIVEREKEINQFTKEKYYQIKGDFSINGQKISGLLFKIKDQPIEIKKIIHLFDGQYQYSKTIIENNNVDSIINDLNNDQFFIEEIEEKEKLKYPPPPFTTSLLQQQSFNQLRFSSKLTMKLAQDLYENGLITYHRTDSFNLSASFLFKAKDYIIKTYGENYSLPSPRNYKTKSKMAQEAHEAIRPTFIDPHPKKLKSLTKNHRRLYELIFNRSLATQMKEAKIKEINILIKSQKNYWLIALSEQIIFDGFLKIFNPKISEKKYQLSYDVNQLKPQQKINLLEITSLEKETQPPPRYTEASLIKSMEEKGIGRPSTYAQIISIISQRHYVEKFGRYFIPTIIGTKIAEFLVKEFPSLFNLEFTATLEDDLDKIASNDKNHLEVLNLFYEELKKRKSTVDYEESLKIEQITDEKCPQCQSPLVVRYSKFGKFLACSRYPECRFTKKILYYVNGFTCPKCQGRLVIKFSKNKKKFYGCENYPKCDYSTWKLPKKV